MRLPKMRTSISIDDENEHDDDEKKEKLIVTNSGSNNGSGFFVIASIFATMLIYFVLLDNNNQLLLSSSMTTSAAAATTTKITALQQQQGGGNSSSSNSQHENNNNNNNNNRKEEGRRRLGEEKKADGEEEKKADDPAVNILYIITSLAEYNNGARATAHGSDRLKETIIPIISEGVHSMIGAPFHYHVDVYFICAYELLPERYQLIRDALPAHVGLKFWDDAFPLSSGVDRLPTDRIRNKDTALVRQHRFVIKDEFMNYNFFAAFEDDMLIKGYHIENYIEMSKRLYELRKTAPDTIEGIDKDNFYYSQLTKKQLQRTIPGFIRMEVLLNEDRYKAQQNTGPVPIDLDFGNNRNEYVDPVSCCHVSEERANEKIPARPTHDKLMTWEINIEPLGVRKMPSLSSSSRNKKDYTLDWVVQQRGPKYDQIDGYKDYWSGDDGNYFDKSFRRPGPEERRYVNNQGGWMGTRQQIFEWHNTVCEGSFLPPFDDPHFRFDGLDLRDVEWWSGGLQLVTRRHACNMQRIISIDNPTQFSKHILYHTANNKQIQLQNAHEKRFIKGDTLLGQLNTVRKNAEKKIKQN